MYMNQVIKNLLLIWLILNQELLKELFNMYKN